MEWFLKTHKKKKRVSTKKLIKQIKLMIDSDEVFEGIYAVANYFKKSRKVRVYFSTSRTKTLKY